MSIHQSYKIEDFTKLYVIYNFHTRCLNHTGYTPNLECCLDPVMLEHQETHMQCSGGMGPEIKNSSSHMKGMHFTWDYFGSFLGHTQQCSDLI